MFSSVLVTALIGPVFGVLPERYPLLSLVFSYALVVMTTWLASYFTWKYGERPGIAFGIRIALGMKLKALNRTGERSEADGAFTASSVEAS